MNRIKRIYYSMVQSFGSFIARTKWCFNRGSRLDTLEFINELYNLRKGIK